MTESNARCRNVSSSLRMSRAVSRRSTSTGTVFRSSSIIIVIGAAIGDRITVADRTVMRGRVYNYRTGVVGKAGSVSREITVHQWSLRPTA